MGIDSAIFVLGSDSAHVERDRGSTDEIELSVDGLTGQTDVFEALRERDLSRSSINTDGARRITRRLCEEAKL